ncbi:hypothetical protein GCM10011511_04960 [Puia dinghuensis]|uniref:Uncharacterized protein n=2 Tax=Puia dinghuensis TaxID=1792502 RepID=A0A8J2XQZ3_9BACT|nr:hypothetical protein GCM10011511_04960 [Puia dinghuensis]
MLDATGKGYVKRPKKGGRPLGLRVGGSLPGSPAFLPRKRSKATRVKGMSQMKFLKTINITIMADLKRRTLQLSSGKQVKLFGNSVAIGKSLEIGEGGPPNILSLVEEQPDDKIPAGLSNPHRLTVDELMDLADFNIQLWMDLKAGLRKYGLVDPKIFGQDAAKAPSASQEKPDAGRRRKTAEKESQ